MGGGAKKILCKSATLSALYTLAAAIIPNNLKILLFDIPNSRTNSLQCVYF